MQRVTQAEVKVKVEWIRFLPSHLGRSLYRSESRRTFSTAC